MSKEDAEREAVRQMGDPVETGCALNRIHRPAFPWKLFVLAVFLTGASMLISLTIDAKSMRAEYRRRRSVRCLWSMQSVLQ